MEHVARMFTLLGDSAAEAKKNAETVIAIETALAKVALTRVERRDPYKVYHRMKVSELAALAPSFDWDGYLKATGAPATPTLDVTEPEFFKGLEAQLKSRSLADWKTYLRWHLVNSNAQMLSRKFVDADFDFFRGYLRGVKEQQPRWKRCVQYVDNFLGEALGQVFVKRNFSEELKQDAVEMVTEIQKVMEQRLSELDWMAPETKKQAQKKLSAMKNKIGYPDKWRDYSALEVQRGDFFGNMERAAIFESNRQLNKIGKPVDRGEWELSPATVNAYYSPKMNDMNFPAGVLQPPLYDGKMDAAPNYGNTGGTIGHELVHGFDDEGRQFDAQGNLRDWWTAEDAKRYEARAACVADQYAQYTIIDDIKINSKLTLGEDIADVAGTVIAYEAWRNATKNQRLRPIDGLTPDQRFFIGFAQWDCADMTDAEKRVRALTDPHSPAKYRINGVVVNMPEFADAFSCKQGQPMVKKPEDVCKIW
jgi:putative endopeptidase